MTSSFKDFSRGWSLCFRRGRSSWKSLKNLNTGGVGSLSILRISLAAPWWVPLASSSWFARGKNSHG